MKYIQRRGDGWFETVDEFETKAEANEMLVEYIMSDPTAEYWISSRCCNSWKDEED